MEREPEDGGGQMCCSTPVVSALRSLKKPRVEVKRHVLQGPGERSRRAAPAAPQSARHG